MVERLRLAGDVNLLAAIDNRMLTVADRDGPETVYSNLETQAPRLDRGPAIPALPPAMRGWMAGWRWRAVFENWSLLPAVAIG